MVASSIANGNRTKKSQKVFKPEDFMPDSFKLESTEQNEEGQAVRLQSQFAALRNRVKG